MQHPMDLSDVVLADSEGTPVRLGGLIDRPTIIDMVRYYGCAPCRDQLMLLTDNLDRVSALGGAAMGIGPAAAYQAQLLATRQAIPFPLLLDPDHVVAQRVGLHRQSWLRFVFDLRAWVRWLRGFVRRGQGRITGAHWETPGIVIVDAAATVRWVYRGRSIGDYPPLETTLDQLAAIAGSG